MLEMSQTTPRAATDADEHNQHDLDAEAGPSDWYARSRSASTATAPPIGWRQTSTMAPDEPDVTPFRFASMRQMPQATVADVAGMIALGTASGQVLIYSFGQQLLHELGIDATPVTAIKISPDQTFVAAGHASGNVYLWDLARPSKPARSAIALTEQQYSSGRKDGHLAGVDITRIDFCGARHTSIVTGDANGKAFWWSLGRVMGVDSTDVVRILGSDRRDTTLYSVVSLGPQLVALQTPVKLVIVAMKPEPKTVFRKMRAFAETGSAIWNGSMLAYSWADAIYLLDGGITERGVLKANGNVRSMAWYGDHLLVMTHDIMLMRLDGTVVDSAPLLRDARNLRVYREKIFCLADNVFQAGDLLHWNDRILHWVERGDYCRAIRLAMRYYDGSASGNYFYVPEKAAIAQRVHDLVYASLAWAFAPDRLYEQGDLTSVYESLANVCVEAHAFVALDDTYDFFQRAGIEGIFIAALEPMIDGLQVSPALAKELLNHGSDLEHIICRIEPAVLDVDQALRLAEQHGLWDAMLHVYSTLHDFCAPIRRWEAPPSVLFAYLESILTGYTYPSRMETTEGKEPLYRMLVSEGYLSLLLSRDAARMLSVLDAAFEHSYLDEAQYSRQTIINMLLPLRQVYSTMFSARNVAKYPQFIHLAPLTCHQILLDLADGEDMVEERELAAEYLLSVYKPHQSIEAVLEAGKFWRLLLQLYERNRDYRQIVRVLVKNVDATTFDRLESLIKYDVADEILRALPTLLECDIAQTARIALQIGYDGSDLVDQERVVFLGALPTLTVAQQYDYARLLRDFLPDKLLPYLEQHDLDWTRLIPIVKEHPRAYIMVLDRANDSTLFKHAGALIRRDPTLAAQIVEVAVRKQALDDVVHALVQSRQLHLLGPYLAQLDTSRLLELPESESFMSDLLYVYGRESETSSACRRVVASDLHHSVDGRIKAGLSGWRQTAVA